MKNKILFALFWWTTIPYVFVYLISKNRDTLTIDVRRWAECAQIPVKDTNKTIVQLMFLLVNVEEFRNVYYLWVGYWSAILFWLRPLSSLYIRMKSEDFGAGTFIQHGYSTGIAAKHIGKNCWINQMVSIGFNSSKNRKMGNPWIGDNVRIATGARIYGPVKIGDDSVIGTNAVVLKDVPKNTTVIPSPTIILYQDGDRVNKKL